ncbi:MAG: rod shape-determining protein MreD [Rhodobacter sp.]|nr:rod shape-determining protein MreD [Paracoccaceae bacterium]MCC0076147.1 rod shape-determining protein MreD [Rhodobacter sp.]
MNELPRLNTLAYLGLWLAIAAGLILMRMLPLSSGQGGWPAPDVLLALTLAWVLRRPTQLPAPVIALVFLVEDLFLMRPPGLWALTVLVGTEFLRRRQSVVRELNLMLEWGMVAAVITAMFFAYRMGLAIVIAPRAPLDLSLMQLVFTVLVYPLVVWGLQNVLRVRKPATGELDELGRKL